MGERSRAYRFLVGKFEEKRPLGRPRRRWKDGSSGSGMGGHGLDLSSSGQGNVAGTSKCGNELSGSIKYG
jgi:hypothetical protein